MFVRLKELIAAEPCLAHADLAAPFRLETDMSNFAYGASLSQKQTDGKYHPVGFMSKSMLLAERNYDAYDKEALGIVKPLQHWRYWLQGTKKPIEITMDHWNLLSGFNNQPTPSKQHLRWLEILHHFNYVVGYRPGAKNVAVDALSRRPDHLPDGEPLPVFKPFPDEKIKPIMELDDTKDGMFGVGEWAFLNLVDMDMMLQEEISQA